MSCLVRVMMVNWLQIRWSKTILSIKSISLACNLGWVMQQYVKRICANTWIKFQFGLYYIKNLTNNNIDVNLMHTWTSVWVLRTANARQNSIFFLFHCFCTFCNFLFKNNQKCGKKHIFGIFSVQLILPKCYPSGPLRPPPLKIAVLLTPFHIVSLSTLFV